MSNPGVYCCDVKARYRLFMALAVGALFVVNCHSNSVDAQPVTLKFATSLPPTNPIVTDIYEPWAKRLNEAAAGEFQVQLYPATFANTTQVWERTVNGVADMSVIILPSTGLPFARSSVSTVPGVADDTTAGSVALWRLYAKGLSTDEFKDVKLINLVTVPKLGIASKEPILKLEDLKGLKVRAVDKNSGDAITALGGTPIGIPFSEMYQALSKGVVSAAIGNSYSMTAFKLGEVTKNFMPTISFGMTPSAIVMNKDVYAKLSPKGKAIIDRFSGEDSSRDMGADHGRLDAKLMNEVRASVTVRDLSPQEVARWRPVLDRTAKEWAASVPEGDKVLSTFKADYEEALVKR